LDVTSPLRVVQNGSTRDHADVLEAAESETDSPRILSATSSAARATRTAVRDLRDAFMVTVSSPGETVTRSQPPDGVTGSIGGVTPLFNEPMTVVRVRNVVLVMLGFVALIVVLVAGAAILIERRLNPPPAATAPINP
jgi:phage shock protein PspC (stress-responsive transcriptional regulator)